MNDEKNYKPTDAQLASAAEKSLTPIDKFIDKYPPREPFVQHSVAMVYLHAGSRFQIAYERTGDIGYGLWRDDELAELGISGAIEDSAAFGKGLIQAIGDQMSLRNLWDLRDALNAEIAEQEASRQRHIAQKSD